MNNFIIKTPFVVDVSSHEDKQDWSKCDPIPYIAIARTTYGITLIDNSFSHNWKQWGDLGIRRGAYHFIRPEYSADDQAKFFIEQINKVGGFVETDLPPILDFETVGLSAHQIKVWLDRVEGEFGVKPMIYTRKDTWETIGTPSWTNDYPFWIAWYPYTNYIDANSTIPDNRMPDGLDRWALWQYSEAGRLDFDPYNGYDFNAIADWYFNEINAPVESDKVQFLFEPKDALLFPDGDEDFVRFFRTPDDNENHSFHFAPWSFDTPIEISNIPEFRKHLKGINEEGEPVYNIVPNFISTSDQKNLDEDWVFVFVNDVRLNNGNWRELHSHWTENGDGNWGVSGCYVRKRNIKENPILLKGKVVSWTGVNIRKAPTTDAEKFAAVWHGKEVEGSELIKENNNTWMKINGYVAVEHDEKTLIELENTPSLVKFTAKIYTVPNDGNNYFWLLPDDLSPAWGKYRQETFDPPDKYLAMPQTVVLYKDSKEDLWLPLPEKWQWFIYDLLKLDAPGQTKEYYLSAYESLVADHRAFTDLHKKDEHTDYVLGRNLELDKPYYWKVSITTAGNAVRGYKNGSELILDGLDITKDPPNAEDVYDKWWLIHKATQVYPKILADGNVKTTHFPQIKTLINEKFEKSGTSVPFFIPPVGIPANLAKPLVAGETFKIVNLERDQL